ncbi:MAG TPA: class I SAM-dependent methyltransferase [Pseudonocardiaceae bacterium]|jgi:SAM-dependent methyltransferase|nr:class I SAM-dependent methyltransferase [Pseudonocardiaceae bacterium]
MTEQGLKAAQPWRDVDYASGWANADVVGEMLAFPRALAAALVKEDRPQTMTLVDIGSGTGTFLSVFLDEFPNARGVWTDASEAMLDMAKERLAKYGDRVEFKVVDMTDLAAGNLPTDADVVMTSRAAHHLDRTGLHAFYKEAAAHLAPGGWLVNLDHVGSKNDEWDTLFRTVRKRFQAPAPDAKPHHHNYPLTGVQDHTDALDAAGLTDRETAWRGLISCLFVARTAG